MHEKNNKNLNLNFAWLPKLLQTLTKNSFFNHFRDDQEERQPLSTSNGYKKGSIVESDGKVILGDIIGKNSAV